MKGTQGVSPKAEHEAEVLVADIHGGEQRRLRADAIPHVEQLTDVHQDHGRGDEAVLLVLHPGEHGVEEHPEEETGPALEKKLQLESAVRRDARVEARSHEEILNQVARGVKGLSIRLAVGIKKNAYGDGDEAGNAEQRTELVVDDAQVKDTQCDQDGDQHKGDPEATMPVHTVSEPRAIRLRHSFYLRSGHEHLQKYLQYHPPEIEPRGGPGRHNAPPEGCGICIGPRDRHATVEADTKIKIVRDYQNKHGN